MAQGRDPLQNPYEPQLFHRDQRKHQKPPEDKVPACPMPESGEGPDRQHIAEGHKLSLPAAPQGNIYVIPEPAPQGHVPPPPEFRHGKRQIRVMKIFRDRKAHDPPQPPGHQGIAVKIKIDLEAEGCDGQPCKGGGDTFIAHGPGLIPEPARRFARRTLSPSPMVKVFSPSSTARMEWDRREISFLMEE